MSRVWVLDAITGSLVNPFPAPNPIPTSTNNPNRADELCHDPIDHLVMVANNADDPPFATIISTQTFTVVGQIVFDGTNGAPNSNNGIEQCAWSPRTRLLYISVPGIAGHPAGEGGVAVIDPNTKTVVNTFIIPVDNCAAPQGMAIGPPPQILLGCNGRSPNDGFNTVVIDENNGNIIRTLANDGGADEVWFNPGDGHYFITGGSFLPVEQFAIVDSLLLPPQDQTIQVGTPGGTARRAHSVAADSHTNLAFLPIPATGGGTPGFQSTVCGDLAANGCVAVFGTTNNDPPIVQQ